MADLLTLFCREYHYVRGSRVRRRRGALLPLYLELCLDLDIVLFGRTWVDLCVCCKTIMRRWTTWFSTARGLGQKDTNLFMHCLNWMGSLWSTKVKCHQIKKKKQKKNKTKKQKTKKTNKWAKKIFEINKEMLKFKVFENPILKTNQNLAIQKEK
jgi:hypothetical protein